MIAVEMPQHFVSANAVVGNNINVIFTESTLQKSISSGAAFHQSAAAVKNKFPPALRLHFIPVGFHSLISE